MRRIMILLLTLMPIMVFAINKQKVVLSCDIYCQGCCDKIMKNIAFEKIGKPAQVKSEESPKNLTSR